MTATPNATASPRAVADPDPQRWPGLCAAPRARGRVHIARAVFDHAARQVDLRAQLPGDRWLGGGGPGSPIMRIVREQEFFARLAVDGKIGFGEAYMVGAWDTDDLPGVLAAFAARLSTLVPPRLQWLRRWHDARHPAADSGDAEGARRNIHRHYDLSNDLFGLFLDPTMTYSAALFNAEAATDRHRAEAADPLQHVSLGGKWQGFFGATWHAPERSASGRLTQVAS